MSCVTRAALFERPRIHSKICNEALLHAAITKKVTTDRNTWRCRPISDELLQSAAEDVSHLVILAEKMSLQFGSLLVQLVLGMSAIYSEAFWDDSDKASVGHNSAQSSKLADSWVYKLYTQVAPKT